MGAWYADLVARGFCVKIAGAMAFEVKNPIFYYENVEWIDSFLRNFNQTQTSPLSHLRNKPSSNEELVENNIYASTDAVMNI